MAALGGCSTLLCVVLAVIGTSEGFLSSGKLSFGCQPDDFAVPDTVSTALETCRGPRRGWGWRRGPNLTCLVDELNLTTDSGVDSTAVDALIDSLSSNTTWTDQQKANAAECLEAMSSDLTAQQQGVYVLSCTKMRLKLDCVLQGNDTTGKALCLQAGALNGKMCPLSLKSLGTFAIKRTCKRETRRGSGGTFVSAIASMGGAVLGGSFNGDVSELCGTLNSAARSFANCTLQQAELADGDAVNVTALRSALEGTAFANQSLALLDECEARGSADTVDALLDCWSELAPEACVSVMADQLARRPPPPPRGGFRDRFGGGRPGRPGRGGGRPGGGGFRGFLGRGGRGGRRGRFGRGGPRG